MAGAAVSEADYLEEWRRVARSRAAATAVVDERRSVTYGELVDEVDRRAARLLGLGLCPGHRVAIVAENSADFVASAFAVWAAGGVLATIYPSSAPADLRYAIENADPVLVLADRRTVDAVKDAASPVPVTQIEEAQFTPSALRTGTRTNPVDTREPLFLICYSSGTTSRPKAIMLSQTALYNGARTYADVWRLTENDVTVVCLPMAWLYGLDSTAMATLLIGGTVVALRRARPEGVADAIERHRATFLPAVTTVFAKLVDYLEATGNHHDLSTLRLAVSGGEPRNEAAFSRFRALVGCPVHDTFCASECFPLITYDPVVDPEPMPGSAGRLVPRSELKVLDETGAPVPAGQVGEAYSRGPGLMLGYWRDEEQTEQVLTEDGWYRTKDLVRVDEEGYVYVVGRLSDMIIRGGSNVSPAEVERALREQPAVRDAVVVGVPDAIYGQEVVAAVLVDDAGVVDMGHLHEALSEQLASYKIPTRFVMLDHLPTNTTTGKIDRRAVAALVAGHGQVTA